MRIRGHSAVLWREPGVSQIGTERGHQFVLSGLSTAEQHFLDQLADALRKGDIYHLAQRNLLSTQRAHQIVNQLRVNGAVAPDSEAKLSEPDLVYWDRLGAAATTRSHILGSACVALYGSGAMAQEIVLWFAEAGVGTILLPSKQPDDGLGEMLTKRFPRVSTRAPLRHEPDLVITLESHVIEPLRARRLVQFGMAHLPVTLREVSVRVGPVLGLGGVCATCLDLWERDADPCWPALATQMRTLPPPSLERLVVHQAAVLAARAGIEVLLERASTGAQAEVDAEIDADAGAAADTESVTDSARKAPTNPRAPWLLPQAHLPWNSHSVEVSGTDPLGRRRHWSPHPECLCSKLA